MIISGTITQASQASEPSGQFQVRYQDVVITDQNNTTWPGRIGSKQGYQANTPIVVTVEEKYEQDGTPYCYFRKHNPQYSQGQQVPAQRRPQPQQAPSRTPRAANQSQTSNGEREMRIVRGNSLNAIMSAAEIPLDMV